MPTWFARRLRRVDPALVLQYIPPSRPGILGVEAARFPKGVWAICRKLPHTGWLFKRWVWSLADPAGNYRAPGMDTIHMLRHASSLWRQNRGHEMERIFDQSAAAMAQERYRKTRSELAAKVCKIISVMNERMRPNRVSMYHGVRR